jgi:hypothetical protein
VESEDVDEDETEEWEPCGDPRPHAFKPPTEGFERVCNSVLPTKEPTVPPQAPKRIEAPFESASGAPQTQLSFFEE